MGRLFDPDAYAVGWLSVPYLVAAFGLAIWVAYLLFNRGDPVLRTSLFAGVGLGCIWATFQGFAGTAPDAHAATQFHKLSLATISVVGCAAFASLLAMRDLLHRFRLLLTLSLVSSLSTAVLCVSTDLVVAGVWKTSWDYWYIKAGPLNGVHLGMFVGWAIFGAVLATKAGGRDTERQRQRSRRIVFVAGLMVLGSVDALLANGIGVYSIAWLTGMLAAVVGLAGTLSHDIIRMRGRDRATAPELGLLLVLAGIVFGLFSLTHGAGGVSVLAVVLVVPLMGISQVGFTAVREYANRDTTSDELERAVDELIDEISELHDEAGLVRALEAMLAQRMKLTNIRLLRGDGAGGFELVDPGADEEAEPVRARVDARVRAWIMANRSPLIGDRLATQRLGGLRAPIGELMSGFDALVVLPLIDRNELIGLVVASPREDDRAVSDVELTALVSVQDAVARALTYMTLYRSAKERVEVAREVEIAAAVHHRREAGEQRVSLDKCEIAAYYQPAGQFGGDWWSSAELADGRVLVMIGDVSGQGVPAALVTATVEGCCETAQRVLGAGFTVYDLLQLINRSVLDVGRSRYLMTCWAGVIDREEMSITFANAGHPFPYLCRRSQPGPRGGAMLSALVSKGMPLGIEQDPVISVSTASLDDDDVLVMYTDAIVESENASGARYGDRRLQRAIRTRLVDAGDDMCRRLIDDALGHYGDHPIREDITLVCARVGVPG